MTTTITELEILEEVDISAELPCGMENLHENIVMSTEPAKYFISVRCDMCAGVDSALACEPCVEYLKKYLYRLGHTGCPLGLTPLASLSIVEIREL